MLAENIGKALILTGMSRESLFLQDDEDLLNVFKSRPPLCLYDGLYNLRTLLLKILARLILTITSNV